MKLGKIFAEICLCICAFMLSIQINYETKLVKIYINNKLEPTHIKFVGNNPNIANLEKIDHKNANPQAQAKNDDTSRYGFCSSAWIHYRLKFEISVKSLKQNALR